MMPGEKITCGNCAERKRWEGLERVPQHTWCVWTKTGRRPQFWHSTREGAENEAARLARTHPGKTFIVFEKLVNVRTAQGGEAGTAETGTGSVHEHPVGNADAPDPSSSSISGTPHP